MNQPDPRAIFYDNPQMWRAIQQLERKTEHMATQEEVDQLTKELGDAEIAILAEITALQTANPHLDFSNLRTEVTKIGAIPTPAPAPPTPAPAPAAAAQDQEGQARQAL